MPAAFKKTCRTCGGEAVVPPALPEVEKELEGLRLEQRELEGKLGRVLQRIERLEDLQRRATLGV